MISKILPEHQALGAELAGGAPAWQMNFCVTDELLQVSLLSFPASIKKEAVSV